MIIFYYLDKILIVKSFLLTIFRHILYRRKPMKFLYTPLLILVLQFLACKEKVSLPSPEIIYTINVDNSQDQIDLKLTDLADSFRLIPLETKSQCLLDRGTEYFVTEKYILAYSQDGVYKFSGDGHFIKKIIGLGRGPQELSGGVGISSFVVDQKMGLLFVADQMRRQEYLVYDIMSECFLNPVKKFSPNPALFDIYNDSLIIGSTNSINDSLNYAVFFQNFKGEFISGITNNKKMNFSNKTEIPQWTQLYKADVGYCISFAADDTLFRLKGNRLVPYLVINFEKPRDNPPTADYKEGNHKIFFLNVEASSFMVIRIWNIEKIIRYSSGAEKVSGSYVFFLFNKVTGKSARIDAYTDNFIGKTPENLNNGEYRNFNKIFSGRNIVVAYSPDQIKKAVEIVLNHEDFNDSINKQLIIIKQNLEEMDNPVLLVGTIKQKL